MNENKLKQIISKLSKEDLSEILLHVVNEIPEKQKNELIEMIFKISQDETRKDSKKEYKSRLPQDLVDKKMQQINEWMEQIENGELCFEADGYEDYSDGYWGDTAAKGRIRMLYKDKFPRHSSFQREMKEFFD